MRCCDAWNFFANDTVQSITTCDDAKTVKGQGRWYYVIIRGGTVSPHP